MRTAHLRAAGDDRLELLGQGFAEDAPISPSRTTIATTRSSRSRFATSPMSARPGRSTRMSRRWHAGSWSTLSKGKIDGAADHERGGAGRYPHAAHDDRRAAASARRSLRPAMGWAGASTITAATAGSQHGGGIDGFTSMTTLFPDDGLGLVVLTNMNGTQLPEMLVPARGRPPARPARRSIGMARRSRKRRRARRRAKAAKTKKNTRAPARNDARPSARGVRRRVRASGLWHRQGRARDGKLHFAIQRHRSPARALAFRGLQRPQEPQGPRLRESEGAVPDRREGVCRRPGGRLRAAAEADRLRDAARRQALRSGVPEAVHRRIRAGRQDRSACAWKETLWCSTRRASRPSTLVPDRNDGFKIKEQSGTSLRFVTDSEQPRIGNRPRDTTAVCSRPSGSNPDHRHPVP